MHHNNYNVNFHFILWLQIFFNNPYSVVKILTCITPWYQYQYLEPKNEESVMLREMV